MSRLIDLEGLKEGMTVICTRAYTALFTYGKEYVIFIDDDKLCIRDDEDYLYNLISVLSEFKVKATATNIVINVTLGGENNMTNTMNLTGSKVKKANGAVVLEKPFDIAELVVGAQVFDILMNKWRNVKLVTTKGFQAGDTVYTIDGKLDSRHSLVAIDRMRIKLSKAEIGMIEVATIEKYDTVAWKDGGVKNYYVVFKTESNEYKVFSETVLRRIDTLFLSKEDAFKAVKELNKIV